MDRRTYKRTPVSLESEILVGWKRHPAYIGNVSACGVYLMTAHDEEAAPSQDRDELQLSFTMPTGEPLSINCREMWSCAISPPASMKRMGLKIIDPPLLYREFLLHLQKSMFQPARKEAVL